MSDRRKPPGLHEPAARKPAVPGIAEQSGGAVQVRSVPGDGTALLLWRPLHGVPTSRPAARPAPTPDPEAGVTVLLAEDEPAVRALVSRTLVKAGYHVVAARDGQEALERATGLEALSVLVTDLAMPRMGGLELRTHLRAAHPELPVLFISGHVRDALAGLMPEDSILEKPFRSQELLARIRDLLA